MVHAKPAVAAVEITAAIVSIPAYTSSLCASHSAGLMQRDVSGSETVPPGEIAIELIADMMLIIHTAILATAIPMLTAVM